MDALAELPNGYWLGVSIAFGACVGSFLNVVIYRLPLGQSIVTPRSRCPGCGSAIPAWANLPVLGYALLGGRCLNCKMRISPRYPAIELLTGLLFGALFWRWGLSLELWVYWALSASLVAITFIDFDHHIIPNSITFPGMPLGLLFAWAAPGPPNLPDALLGLLGVGGMMWAVSAGYERLRGRIGLGMGDVKLVAMLGAFLGLQPALGIVVIGSVLGLVQFAVMALFFGAGRFTRLPFGPALAAAGVLHLFDPYLFPRLLGHP